MEKEIPAVVPDFKLRPAPTETTKSQPNMKRVKRFITDLLSLGIRDLVLSTRIGNKTN